MGNIFLVDCNARIQFEFFLCTTLRRYFLLVLARESILNYVIL